MAQMMENKISYLPPEILFMILGYCSIQDVGRLSITSKKFQNIICDENYWRSVSMRLWDRITRSSPYLLLWSIDTIQFLRWKRVAKCLMNNTGDGQSYCYHPDEKIITIGKLRHRKIYKSNSIQIHIELECVKTGEHLIWGNGNGTIYWRKGEKYQGHYQNYKMDGLGEYTWSDGSKYSGTYKDNQKNGLGTETYPNGSQYTGHWKDDKKNGKGVLTWPDGTRYDGRFHMDKMEGKGTMTWPDGFTHSGVWKNDELMNPYKCKHPVIEEYIRQNECTSILTDTTMAPQILFECSKCVILTCQSCSQNGCHPCENSKMRPKWFSGAKCGCVREECKEMAIIVKKRNSKK
eukprot:TRINITY_DN2038_c0_g1_i1.p1 TRINITY_DN2038_c0_g1~~TRINITY_DN2038_c0_g1_i1.p1  ORF type:complete len:397 (-),score=70.71 TRINITY_DN2038_c0_g1_i1:6-1049(-)